MQKEKKIKILIGIIIITINIILVTTLIINIKASIADIQQNYHISDTIVETDESDYISSVQFCLTLLNGLTIIGGVLVLEGCLMLLIIKKRRK